MQINRKLGNRPFEESEIVERQGEACLTVPLANAAHSSVRQGLARSWGLRDAACVWCSGSDTPTPLPRLPQQILRRAVAERRAWACAEAARLGVFWTPGVRFLFSELQSQCNFPLVVWLHHPHHHHNYLRACDSQV